MNSKILLSLATIAAVGAIAIGGTTAYFTSTATSTGNTMTAGTLDLQVGEDGVVSFGNTANGLLTLSNMQPGVASSDITIRVRNNGTLTGNLAFPTGFLTFANNDVPGAPAPDMSAENFAKLVYISTLKVGDVNWLSGYIQNADTNGDGKVSLYEISKYGFGNTGIPLTPGQEIDLTLGFTLGDMFNGCSDANNWNGCDSTYKIVPGEWNVPQGDGINVSMTGKLVQAGH